MKGLDWFKVASDIAWDIDLSAASDAEFRTFIELIGLSAYHLTDGVVPIHTARKYLNTRRVNDALEALSRRGLITLGADSVRVRNYSKFQQTKEQVESFRHRQSRSSELYRMPTLRSEIRERDGDYCRYCGTEVGWGNRRGTAGATYDHVDPNGPNTLDNVVVACRGCNASKGGRSPEEAGMKLVPIQNDTKTESPQSKSKSKSKKEEELEAAPPRTDAGALIAYWIDGSKSRGLVFTSAEKGQFARYAKEVLDQGATFPVAKMAIDKMLDKGLGARLLGQLVNECKKDIPVSDEEHWARIAALRGQA
jgi:5-methylcytosine-specific restriction endonuclease McrA